MINLNPFAITAAITAFTCFGVLIIVFNLGQTKLHKIWAVFNLAVASWATCVLFAAISTSPTIAFVFWKFAHGFGIYVSIVFFHFVSVYCNLQHRILIRTAYLYGICFNFLNFANNGLFLYKGVYFFI